MTIEEKARKVAEIVAELPPIRAWIKTRHVGYEQKRKDKLISESWPRHPHAIIVGSVTVIVATALREAKADALEERAREHRDMQHKTYETKAGVFHGIEASLLLTRAAAIRKGEACATSGAMKR